MTFIQHSLLKAKLSHCDSELSNSLGENNIINNCVELASAIIAIIDALNDNDVIQKDCDSYVYSEVGNVFKKYLKNQREFIIDNENPLYLFHNIPNYVDCFSTLKDCHFTLLLDPNGRLELNIANDNAIYDPFYTSGKSFKQHIDELYSNALKVKLDGTLKYNSKPEQEKSKKLKI